MKKLYLRMLREMKDNYGQFVSIVLIIAIGSMLLSGMFSAVFGINKSVDDYYQTQNLADIWVYYRGITADEVVELAKEDGITDAQSRYTFNADLKIGGTVSTLRIHSVTGINAPYVTSGALPRNKFQCIVDEKYAEANGIAIGQKLELALNDAVIDLTVTGFCLDPEYAYKTKDASAALVDNKAFGYAYADVETLIELNKHSEVYLTYQSEANNQISEEENELNSAKTNFNDKQTEYETSKSEAEKSFAEGYSTLDNLKKQLDDAQSTLNAELSSFNKQISDAQAQIDRAKKSLDAGKAQIDAGYAAYQSIRDTLTEEAQQEQDAAWAAKNEQIDLQYVDLKGQQQELNGKSKQGLNGFASKQNELDAKYKEYKANLAAMEEQEQSTMASLTLVEQELSDAQAQIAEKESQLAEAKADLEEGLDKISKSYQEVLLKVSDYDAAETAIENNENYITHVERNNQSSYSMVNDSLDPIRTVSYVFPLIFFAVAAIIVFISMSKMVENQRTQIAVMQAIGISKGKIRLSFLSYALTSSLLGSIIFALLGYKIIPGVFVESFVSRFALPEITIPLNAEYIIAPFILAALFSMTAALFAIHKVLKEVPAQAMRPRPPKSSKAILAERIVPLWKRLSYSSKLIFRNICLNKKRVLLSSVGIIGSVMFLITGLSLKYSAQTVINSAMESMSYDLRITYNDPVENIETLSFEYPTDRVELTQAYNATVKLNADFDTNLQIVEENSRLVNLFDQKGVLLPFFQDSVIIPKSMADEYSLKTGDPITVAINSKEYFMTITGIAVEYAAKSIYVSCPAAEKAGIDTTSKSAFISLQNPEGADVAAQAISSQDGVKIVNTKENMIQRSREMMGTLNTMILIIIIGAAVLSMTVIYNITSIAIFERTREFATLMVLGYYKKEVNRLMFVENMVTTAFGCIVGLPFGAALSRYIISLMSSNNLSFPSTLNAAVAAASIILTFAFSVFANILLKTKVKKIVLVEALKSVE